MMVQQILQIVKDDVETITGKNIRYILTELDQQDIFLTGEACSRNTVVCVVVVCVYLYLT